MLKNVFAIDETLDKNNELYDGEIFVTKMLDEADEEELDRKLEKIDETTDEILDKAEKDKIKSSVPLWLKIGTVLSAVLWTVLTVVIFRSAGSLEKLFKAGSFLPYIWFVVTCAFIFLYSYRKRLVNKARSDHYDELTEEVDKEEELYYDELYKKLGVPENAEYMDVLSYVYKTVKGKEVRSKLGWDYVNVDAKAYTENGNLCLATATQKIEIPLSSITGIRKINEDISLLSWNKKTPYTEGVYAKYGIKKGSFGGVKVSYYYALQIEYDGMNYEIFIPCYEAEKIANLTGLICS